MADKGEKKEKQASSLQPKQLIFILFVLFLIAIIAAAFQYRELVSKNIIWLALIAAVLLIFWRFDFLIMLKDYERAVIYRFGKVNRVGGPGWTIILPPIESYAPVDLRTLTLDVPKQNVVTKDNIEVKIDAVVYLKVNKDRQSIINSIIEVKDYKEASSLYVTALLRDILGGMELNEVIANIEKINTKMKEGLKTVSTDWGVTVDDVVIQSVDIPKTVLEAMHLQKAAVQEKLARVERAEAHMKEIEAVKAAAEQLSDRALAYYYLQALEKIGESRSTKFIFPMELSKLAEAITGRMGRSEEKDIEQLFKKYAPAVKALVEKEKKNSKI